MIALVVSMALADWSQELTNQRSSPSSPSGYVFGALSTSRSASDSDGNGAPDCSGGSVNGAAVPMRPSGGWFEWRFVKHQGGIAQPSQTFYNVPFGPSGALTGTAIIDVTRLCPRTFNEYTTNHLHGVMNARLAWVGSDVFAVYDSASGYYWQNKIKLQQNPRTDASNQERSYTAVDLARNPRNWVDTNPGSRTYVGSALNVCPTGPGDVGVTAASGYLFNPQWNRLQGADHEGTACAPGQMIQTFDPDIDSTAQNTFVVWTERYVSLSGPSPYRRLAVHAEKLSNSSLVNAQRTTSIDRTPLTPMDEAGLNANRAPSGATMVATRDAVSPRVAAFSLLGQDVPFVAWVELTNNVTESVGDHGVMTPAINASIATGTLYSTVVLQTGWTSSALPGVQVCNVQEVSSGRATGRKRSYTGTHDVGISSVGGTATPIVLASVKNSGGICELRAYSVVGGVYSQLGSALSSASPSWPRLFVFDDALYATWVDNGRDVQVARYDGSAWSRLWAASWNSESSSAKRVTGPSITVTRDLSYNDLGQYVPWVAGGPVRIVVAYNEEMVSWPGVVSSGQNVWGVKSKKCQAAVAGSSFACSAIPTLEARSRGFGTGVYAPENAGLIGAAWGTRTSTQVGNVRYESGYASDNLETGAFPGATDTIFDGMGNWRYLSWGGPVGDHRDNDRGLYVKREIVERARQEFVQPTYDHTFVFALPGDYPDPVGWQKKIVLWGNNAYGALGNGNTTTNLVPYTLSLTERISRISGGPGISAALAESRRLYLWGQNANFAIADTGSYSTTPLMYDKPAPGAPGFVDVAIGWNHVLAVTADGNVWGRGNNSLGQLGVGNKTTTTGWRQVAGLSNVVAVFAGADHSCALTKTRALYCFGSNFAGQVGDGTTVDAMSPVLISSIAWQVSLGGNHSAFVDATQKVYVWGANTYGQLGLGDNNNRKSPVFSYQLTDGVIALGYQNTYLLERTTGKAYAAGSDAYGSLGNDATLLDKNTFQQVAAAGWVDEIYAGATSWNAYLTAGEGTSRDRRELSCWGWNGYGQCGYGNTVQKAVPTPMFDPVRFGCAPGTTQFQLFRTRNNYLYGCAGNTTFTSKACGADATVASAADWKTYRADATSEQFAPTANYWTADNLRYSGSGSNACSVSTTAGNDCGANTPMRLCTASGTDAFGNTCNWTNCGYEATAPNQYFGGCAGNLTAGTLCKVANPLLF